MECYIPSLLAKQFAMIAQIFYDNRLFLEVSVPMAMYSIDLKQNMIPLSGVYLQSKYKRWGRWTWNTTIAWKEYNRRIHFLHPYKFFGNDATNNIGKFVEKVAKISNQIINEKCLDVLTI